MQINLQTVSATMSGWFKVLSTVTLCNQIQSHPIFFPKLPPHGKRRTLKLQYSLKHFFENWVSGSREEQKRTQQTVSKMTDAGQILIFLRRAHWSPGDITRYL